MTNEELNTALYQKMFAEQETYREWLLSQPSEEILNHTYEYTVREDILLSMEYNDLPDAQAKALLKSTSPLADVFKDWEHKETGYMEDIWQTVEDRAKSEVEKQKKKDDKERSNTLVRSRRMSKRNIEIKVRLNRKEAEALNKKVKKSRLSRESYLRHLIDGVVPQDSPPPDYYSMMRELHGVASNLNQIAQKAHVLNVVDVQRYDTAVHQVEAAIKAITDTVLLPRRMDDRRV